MKRHFIFGYGSLVNNNTHDHDNIQPAILNGWQRAWRKTPLRPVCYLSIIPVSEGRILGSVSEIRQADWPSLQEREAAYDLINVAADLTIENRPQARLSTFTIPSDRCQIPDPDSQVLLSYLDTVIQGYFDMFGEISVHDFFDSTQDWQSTFVDDRTKPIYRRHQPPANEVINLVDENLARLSAKIEKL